MPIFKVQDNKFIKLPSTTFEMEKIYEVKDFQKYLSNSIEVIDNDLLVISTEFSDWEDSKRSIDILCIDVDGNLVVIEIKRTQDGGHMELQSIRYSAMIANMKFDKAVKTYEAYLKKINSQIDAETKLLNFLGWADIKVDEFAQEVKIILISSDFSIEVTTSVLWLNEKELDIRCIKVKLQKDDENVYFDIQQIIPLPESTDYQIKLKEKAAEERLIRTENKREQSIVSKLFDSNKLYIGQKIILKPAIEQNIAKELVTATITRRGKKCLKLESDDNIYSFSNLRGVLVKRYNLQNVKPEWGFTLRNDWMIESGKTLAELENN